MKMKRMIFALVLSFMIVLVAGSVMAEDKCSSAELNRTRVVQLLNGCGSYAEVCVYYAPCPPTTKNCGWRHPAGYYWQRLAPYLVGGYDLSYVGISNNFYVCMSNAESNPCCDSPCGYKFGPYEECKSCNESSQSWGSSYNLSDYSKCSFSNGFCVSAVCDMQSPYFVSNQGDINLSERKPIAIDFSFFENMGLKEFNIKACKQTGSAIVCFNETVNLTGMEFTSKWAFPSNIARWIDQMADGSSTIDISLTVFDKGGLGNESLNAFKIIGEDIPQITADAIPNLQFGQRANINPHIVEMLSGVKIVKISIDGALSKSCSVKECLYEYLPSAGTHGYKIQVEDNGGNIKELSGTFSVAGTEKSCAEIGGAVCLESEKCTNGESVSTTDAESCCTSSCYTEIITSIGETCSSQNGIIYDPSLNDCSSVIRANDTVGNNRCCGVQTTDKSEVQENNVYWVDSIGNHIFGVLSQEDVKCISSGNVQQLQIIKDGTVQLDKAASQLSLRVDEVGQYVCRAVYSNGAEKESALNVIELPAPTDSEKAKLPGFGWIQFIVALALVSLYGLVRKK